MPSADYDMDAVYAENAGNYLGHPSLEWNYLGHPSLENNFKNEPVRTIKINK